MKSEVKRLLGNKDNLLVLEYGSQVYGTRNFSSDYDFIAVGSSLEDDKEIVDGYLNVHTYKPDTFQMHLTNHRIFAMEAFMNSEEAFLKFDFKLDLPKLREEISQKSSNSWVKCKKKLTVEPPDAYRTGVKSMWHSLRIIMFGIQIAKHGKIVDFHKANYLYGDIVDNIGLPGWETLKETYQPLYNSLMTEFRLLAPKA